MLHLTNEDGETLRARARADQHCTCER